MYSLSLFKEITQVPRPSGQEEKIRAFLVNKAMNLGYNCQVDSVGNLLIKVLGEGASANAPTVVLQCHMDMVCEQELDLDFDFQEMPLSVYEDEGFLRTRGTTLGADNGVGIALAFYCASLADHPPLEMLFTVDEEVRMSGAANVQKGFFTGRKLINLDSIAFGIVTTGSAGGSDAIFSIPFIEDRSFRAQTQVTLELTGLKGGHSGGHIHLNRLSAVKVISDLLIQYQEANISFRIAEINVGSAPNVIARTAKIELFLVNEQDFDHINRIKSRLNSEDPEEELKILCRKQDFISDKEALSLIEQNELIELLDSLPHGVLAWQNEEIQLPKTSINFASIKQSNGEIRMTLSYRSFDNDVIEEMGTKFRAMASDKGVQFMAGFAYPAWPPAANNPLMTTCAQEYQKIFGSWPKVEAVHAGLECGYWEILSPGIEIVSIGPNLHQIHTPQESLDIESLGKMERWLEAIMASMT